jgi:hypothetical protein
MIPYLAIRPCMLNMLGLAGRMYDNVTLRSSILPAATVLHKEEAPRQVGVNVRVWREPSRTRSLAPACQN